MIDRRVALTDRKGEALAILAFVARGADEA